MISGFQKLACIFFIYSIGGWIMESTRGWIKTGKFVNRGFLIGPCLPVYGFGLVLLTLMLEDYTNDIFVLFTSSIFICGVLEYFTSWAMEKIFKARWWDYHNRKFNINGRICLETLVPFGLAGTILLKYVNPFALNLISKIPSNILKLILIFLFLTIIIDAVISFFVIGNLRKTATEVEKEVVKDDTEEISNQVREITTRKIEEITENTKNKLEELPDKIDIRVKKLEEDLHYTREKIKIAIQDKITTTKEYTEEVKRKFGKNWLNRRFLKAFPNMEISSKILKLKEKIEKK